MVRVLVVEDDARLNQIVCTSLRAAGYEAIGCANAAQATDALHGDGADIIISDIMMPGVDGFEFVSEVRSVNRHIPILLMTALDDMSAKRKGFGAGIDAYMVKPIDVDERSAYVGGKEITLTVREFDLLYKLLSYPRRTFSRAQLMDEFWDGETSASLRAVDVYITRIRDKMSVSDDFKITTVHGLGYKAVPGA